MAMALWSIGYGAWPVAVRAERMVRALKDRGVNLLVDVRLEPCSSNAMEGHRYGPKDWTLQAGGSGIAHLVRSADIDYEWLVELGNPQRQVPGMEVLRAHLADREGHWPVHRGLALLAERLRRPGAVVAVLCACADASHCHRTLVAEAMRDRHFGGDLMIRNV
jgi:hypothetical protein